MENPQPEPLVVPSEDVPITPPPTPEYVPISPPPTPDYGYVSEPPSPIFKPCGSIHFVLRNIGVPEVEDP